RLHLRQGHGPRPRRGQAAVQRIFYRIQARRRHQSHHCTLEVIMKSVGVNDQSGVAEARRAATDLAQRMGFTETDAGKLALVATELSTNLVKHGSGGEILVGAYEDNE